MTYAEKLKDPRWQRKRLDILNRDAFTCKYCEDRYTTLNVHHLSYNKNPWDVENDQLVTLCEHCHKAIEYIKKNHSYFFCKGIYKSPSVGGANARLFVRIGDSIEDDSFDSILVFDYKKELHFIASLFAYQVIMMNNLLEIPAISVNNLIEDQETLSEVDSKSEAP